MEVAIMSQSKQSTWYAVQSQGSLLVLAAGLLLVVMGPAQADFVFGMAENAGPLINTSVHEIEPLPGYLEMWFSRRFGATDWDRWRVSQAIEDAPWEDPVNYGPLVESSFNLLKIIPSHTTADGLELYVYASRQRRPDGYGGLDLYVKKREKLEDDWGPGINLGPVVNGPYDEGFPAVSPDGLELYFSGWNRDARPGGFGRADLWVTRRETRDAEWGEPVNLGPTVNKASFDARPSLSADGLLLFFESDRHDGHGSVDVYFMRRATLSDPWSEPRNLGMQVNGPYSDENGVISPNGSTVYFHSDRPDGYGGYDIWQAPVVPIVDFSGDGFVDDTDLSIMEGHWGQNYPPCDIGPMPWGDGVVDEMDKQVLLTYYGEVIDDPSLISHWKLDETEGNLALDSQGNHDGLVYGNAMWQPSVGRFGGALQFDGVNNYIETDLIHDPCEQPFRVFAWIKGGAAGQAIVSQQTPAGILSSVWLGLDPVDGRLMSSHMYPVVPLLKSNSIVLDDQWHHVGLIWDGTYRSLWADGEEVASDTAPVVPLASSGKLRIGAGSGLESNSFWAGLIDDVRFVDPSGPQPVEIKKELKGFQIYDDDTAPGAYFTNYSGQGTADYFWETNPIEGERCIYWADAAQYNAITIDFWPDKDLTYLVDEGYALEFWVRSSGPSTAFHKLYDYAAFFCAAKGLPV